MASAVTISVLTCGGCLTRAVGPEASQIEIGLQYARQHSPSAANPPIYTNTAAHPYPRPLVALVVSRSVASAEPQKIRASNAYTGLALTFVETNPTLLVVKSMAAYLSNHAEIEIVPDLKAVSPRVDLILEPVVDAIEWRYSGWEYAYFAHRIEARVSLTLRDHTDRRDHSWRSDWVTGGTYVSTSPTGAARRVIRAVAHATAAVLDKAEVVARLASP